MYSYVRAIQAKTLDLQGFIHEVKRIGADGVELLEFFVQDPEKDRETALEALDQTGLRCSVFSVGQNFAKPSLEERQRELQKVFFGVEQAPLYGAKVVRVFAGDVSEGMTFPEAREWIVDGLAEASVIANNNGVALALENHGKLAGRGDQVRQIIEDVRQKSGNDALGSNPDTGNFLLVGQKSDEAVAQVAEFAYMVHFKDFMREPVGHKGFAYSALDGTRYVGTAIGEGEVDLPRCVRILKESGFDGWLNIEYEGEEDPITAVERSVQTAKRILTQS